MKPADDLPAAIAEIDDNQALAAKPACHQTEARTRGVEPLYVQPAAACARWGIGKTSLYKAINGKLPGCERLPKIVVVKFGASTLIHVPSGDAFFSQLPRYGGDVSS